MELGPKDLAKNACVLARRDLPGKEAKEMGVPLTAAAGTHRRAAASDAEGPVRAGPPLSRQDDAQVDSYDEFKKLIEEPGGFLWAHWDGTRETEDRIAAETKATIRCIPFNRPKETGKCMVTGQPSAGRVVFARAY